MSDEAQESTAGGLPEPAEESLAAAPSIEVILPVRNMGQELREALPLIVSQLAAGDRVTVVDDGSTDDTSAIAGSLGAAVIRLDASGGPYAARNVAAAASDADVLLFVDGRSRCRPGLLESHRRLQSAQDVALSCSPITVEAGSTLASRAASLQDLFALTAFVGVPGRLDYYPTANLGVRRSAYLEVGGFREIRSGGDADLCWRIELAGLGRLASEDRTYMTWIPRKRIRGLLEQWYRYGQSAAYLEIMYPENGVPTEDHSRPLKAALRIAKSVAEAPKLAPVALVSGITHAVFRLSYVQARHSLRRSPRVTAMGEFSAARR